MRETSGSQAGGAAGCRARPRRRQCGNERGLGRRRARYGCRWREADGLGNDQIHQLDDGGVALFGGGLLGGRFRFGEVDLGIREFLQHGVDRLRFRLAIMAIDGLDDLLAGRQNRQNFLVENELQLLDRVEIGRIVDDDLERAVFLRQRNDDVFAGHRFRHQLDDRRREW